MAAPRTTGVIDTAIHNQRIAVIEIASGKLRQVSPAEIHVYDYDWSPDDKMFVATAAPGPGDNNWWIAQIWTMSSAKGDATFGLQAFAASLRSALVSRRQLDRVHRGLDER